MQVKRYLAEAEAQADDGGEEAAEPESAEGSGSDGPSAKRGRKGSKAEAPVKYACYLLTSCFPSQHQLGQDRTAPVKNAVVAMAEDHQSGPRHLPQKAGQHCEA